MPVDIDFSKIGKRIRSARKERKMTQEELAHACGCTSNHLSSVETGASKPSLELLIRLATVLNSSIDYFLLDTPCASHNYLINSRIAPKLDACSTYELQYIEHVIDELFKYRDQIQNAQ